MIILDYPAVRTAAAQIAETAPFQAAEIAINIEPTNPLLAAEIRKALGRRATRTQQHTTPRGQFGGSR